MKLYFKVKQILLVMSFFSFGFIKANPFEFLLPNWCMRFSNTFFTESSPSLVEVKRTIHCHWPCPMCTWNPNSRVTKFYEDYLSTQKLTHEGLPISLSDRFRRHFAYRLIAVFYENFVKQEMGKIKNLLGYFGPSAFEDYAKNYKDYMANCDTIIEDYSAKATRLRADIGKSLGREEDQLDCLLLGWFFCPPKMP